MTISNLSSLLPLDYSNPWPSLSRTISNSPDCSSPPIIIIMSHFRPPPDYSDPPVYSVLESNWINERWKWSLVQRISQRLLARYFYESLHCFLCFSLAALIWICPIRKSTLADINFELSWTTVSRNNLGWAEWLQLIPLHRSEKDTISILSHFIFCKIHKTDKEIPLVK